MAKLVVFRNKITKEEVEANLCIPCTNHLEKNSPLMRAIPLKQTASKCFVCGKD